ncbi:IS3 family transposase [Xanthomonas hydrangeae]|uniref:IS3 family transposase n=1 Tax=Xanthomonas hydrangeae TaxID=2775159 RepID=A0AAU0B5M5_9XANT|nr:IS3 family transposase [Xanthomonas hydrangeae]WOB48040.1 IS3 family transposase [Xanthomonas hydrangeae]WOB48252.1 IS3 family transposase [Xanthomonas hydrangeae]WOB49489.1 IS3 family transposase [Xanthomonas hydrangeae]WOB50510.1 IS3 family transposase [Xanthomonas hydrangeae]WOB50666.1 IS3 family transposase [Xanthomonas hydrangeae]
MHRYDARFKLQVAKEACKTSISVKAVARRHGLEFSTVRRWAATYQLHGWRGFHRKARSYDLAFKLEVLEKMRQEGMSAREATTYFQIGSAGAVAHWQRLYADGAAQALSPPQKPMKKKRSSKPAEDMSRDELLKEVAYLRAETAYFKKTRCLDPGRAGGAARKAQAVHGLRQTYALPLLLKAAELSRSTFYYQIRALARPDEGEIDLCERIRAIYDENQGRYGYRRIALELANQGERINHKRVQRLMAGLGLRSRVRIKRYRAFKGAANVIVANELSRQFEAQMPNQKWVTDVTEFKVQGMKLYLSPIMDLYNGEIVAYQMKRRPVFDLVGQMLDQAIKKLSPDARPMIHSDQGWHYQHENYRHQLEKHSLKQSMSRRGNCLDNAAMESFFGTLKSEFFYLNSFDSVESLEAGLVEYIRYYNEDRIKLKLKGLSPVKYREQSKLVA